MNLRSPIRSQQLIFAAIAFGLAAAAPAAFADETLILKDGKQSTVKVVGVTGSSLMVKTQFGQQGIPLATISQVVMPEPPELKAALQALDAKDYTKALQLARGLAEKYRGMPTPWAISVSSLVGDIQLAREDAPGADLAYNEFAKAYPDNSGADLGRARVAIYKKDYQKAKKTAAPICEKALKDTNVTQQTGQVYGQAFYVMGQVKAAEGDYNGALEDYLRTVTLFYHDRSAAALAQKEADALRATRTAFVP